ncbi:MAG: PhzF family phenazine biosynthesis protein [Dehalococcoidia bacterium]
MKIPFFHIDAFTSKVFAGNPAVVCPLERWLSDETLLAIAHENNQSETAFLVRQDGKYFIRWFSPSTEVDLCGHATLASAYVIFEYLDPSKDQVEFESRSDTLRVTRENGLLSLDFPSRTPEPCEAPAKLVRALGIDPAETLRAVDYMAIYKHPDDVLNLKPDMSLLKELDLRGVIVTAPGSELQVDFVSRFFAPKLGIDEDPVTGSAHCTLTPYWANRLQVERLHALQLSRRGGELFCRDQGNRVIISGHAVKYSEGYIEIEGI